MFDTKEYIFFSNKTYYVLPLRYTTDSKNTKTNTQANKIKNMHLTSAKTENFQSILLLCSLKLN